MKEKTITLGGGCFWCIEAVFISMPGVLSAESGYAGGPSPETTYQEVCTGQTGHAEVVKVTFDEEKISLKQILEIFFKAHDPTTLNRQGNDVGTQYRSCIFYSEETQKEVIESVMKEEQAQWHLPLTTEVRSLENYSRAEQEHQDYYRQHRDQGYCAYVIRPKMEKLGLE